MTTTPGRDLWDNPMGTDGFEFVEYTGPDPQALAALFERMGFVAAARHRSMRISDGRSTTLRIAAVASKRLIASDQRRFS